MTTDQPDLLKAALALHAAGLCVLPASEDGSKRPAVDWKRYQRERPTEADLRAWFTPVNGRPAFTGLGVVAGAVSGGIELTEIEGRAVQADALVRLAEVVEAAGERELWDRIVKGYCVVSPAGGIHMVTRLATGDVPGNTKLAAQADNVTLAETRGEGGWFITAPSYGNVHPTKRPWAFIQGSPATIPTITHDERERFHAILRTLDERPVPTPSAPPVFGTLARAGGTDGVSPGDDYNARTTWDEVLTEAGWRRAFSRGDVVHWTRPGKDHGISATTGFGEGDWLYPFTSSTVLEPERTYTRFGFAAAWHYGGDHQAAAKGLQRLGYGKAATVVQMPVNRPALASAMAEVDGTAALSLVPGEAEVQPFGLTDLGNASMLVAQYGHRLRYVPERGAWMRWSEHRWVFDEAGEHVELAKATLLEAARMAEDPKAAQHFQRSMSRRGIEAAVALARTDPSVVVPITALDARPDLLCTPMGTVDLRTGEIRPPARDELHTRSTTVAPDFAQATPRWAQFLTDTYGDDLELIAYMQRLLGYCLTGETSAHILPFLYGASGQNGKSVLVQVMVKLLGGYATTAPGSFLTQGPSQHETEIARLHGVRFCGCSEAEPGARFAEAKVKMLTGGDEITARFMRREHFTYTPTAKLLLMANDRPTVASGGTSFWRRVRLIHHQFQVPAERRIDGLDAILVAEEGPGILAWLVAGARDFYAKGLREPASVKAATAEYAADEDDLGRFIADRLIVAEGDARAHILTPTPVITAAYHRWCAEEGVEPVSAKRFGMELRTRAGVEAHRSNGKRFYLGVSLADTDSGPFAALAPNPITY